VSRTRRAIPAGVVLAALALPVLLPAAASAQPVCDDLLVTHRPGGSSGALEAVAITAQALDRAVDGWAMVGWEVAADTQLRRVVAVTPDGEDQLPVTATVADGGVLELRFCGSSTAAASGADVARTGPADTSDADVAITTVARDGSTPTGAVGYAAGFIRRAGAGHDGTVRLSILGATLGAAVGGVVLLLSRGARNEVIR
jgi:hypothetical protein